MDANQETVSNPFGMDDTCQNCPELCDTRSQVVHGYGDVGADFVFVGEAPSEGPDRTGVPFTGDDVGRSIQSMLADLGFVTSAPGGTEPEVDNVYLTYMTRCRDPERTPTDEEIRNCEGYLTAELRMINPEIIVPIGQHVLESLAREYTTTRPSEFDIEDAHATTVRGRGFELVPMLPVTEQSADQLQEFLDELSAILDRDYRQTKGRRER